MTRDWLQTVRKPGARTRLYVFPYAGGNPAAFLPWSAGLGPDVELSVVHLPGRGWRHGEPALTDMREAAMSIAAAIAADGAARPAFFGHSMGAVLMLEVARIATLMHLRLPEVMVASGCRWPGMLEPEPLHDLPDPELVARLGEMGGTPAEILADPEIMAIALPSLRSDFEMLHRYRFRPGIALRPPLHVFAGRADPHVGAEHLEGWLRETRSPGKVHWFDGGHFFLHGEQAQFLAALRGVLA
ncbi:thioesterase II family protein [Oceaniglobus roseus]|uniref:thioesterase II family protein n=1 Tax=Oceaniglobus roseus TaxID=1737570 RepID=UPI000C7F77BC|nr:alpha/beta fold hydrolase [Kandeliimicrobium roseum]